MPGSRTALPLNTPRRRELLAAVTAAGAVALWPMPLRAQDLPRLVFAGFELIDDHPIPGSEAVHRARLAAIGQQMASGLQERGLYRVVDLADHPAAQQALEQARSSEEYLHRCNGCLARAGEAGGAALVGVGWVQRVSNLILNLNLGLWATADDRLVLTKSVDIRGDNDESWRRGIAYMLRDMVERRQRQPRYGMPP